MPTRELSYEITSQQVSPGTWRGFIVATCVECKKPTSVQWNSHPNHNFVAKHFQRLGWDFDPHRRSGNRCPDCNKPLPLSSLLPKTPALDLHKFSDRLRWAREQTHVSRDDLATEAAIPRRILDHLEDGTDNRRFEELHVSAGRKLAAALIARGAPIEVNWLIGITETTNVLSLNLRRICERQSITEGRLAMESGVPPMVIRAILNGAVSSSIRAPELAKTLQVDLEVLTGEVSALPKSPGLPAIIGGALRADQLKDARTKKGLSQRDIANLIIKFDTPWRLSTVQGMISKIENGDSPTAPMTLKLLDFATRAMLDIEAAAEPPEPVNGHKINGHVVDPVDREADLVELKAIRADLGACHQLFLELTSQAKACHELYLEQATRADMLEARINETAPVAVPAALAAPATPPAPTPARLSKSHIKVSPADHLKLIHGTWYFRRHVPTDLQERFGKTEIFQNLGTTDRDEALKRKVPFEHAFDIRVQEARIL